jgi:hypothetical protein
VSVKHIVWFAFKEGVTEQQAAAHKRAVLGLREQIPFLKDVEFGEDYVNRADGLTHCVIITVGSRQAVIDYLNHPKHLPVAAALKSDVARLLAMDVEFTQD